MGITWLKSKNSSLFLPRSKPLSFLNLRNRLHRSRMPDYRQPVQDYMRACEALLKLDELSDEEAEVVEEMYGRIADKFLDDVKL